MKEFKVNEYISLKLEGEDTNIYIKGKYFRQCKYLLLNIPITQISSFEEIKSIDEAAESLDHTLDPLIDEEGNIYHSDQIPPEVEFWGHCSNLQVWYENDYDTRLLHRNLAFPLLKKLTEVGDPIAKKEFKKEIAKRMEGGNLNVALYLLEEGYLNYLTEEERELVFYNSNSKLKENVDYVLKRRDNCFSRINSVISEELAKLNKCADTPEVIDNLSYVINKKLEKGNFEVALSLLDKKLGKLVIEKEKKDTLYIEKQKLREDVREKLRENEKEHRNMLFLLKELAELGDDMARKISIEESQKEFKRRDMPLEEFLILKQKREIYNPLRFNIQEDPLRVKYIYDDLDRNIMLALLLKKCDAEAIRELDRLIEKRWIKFKSKLTHEEANNFTEFYRKRALTLKPTPTLEVGKNYSFITKDRRLTKLILNAEGFSEDFRGKELFRLLGFPEPILKLTSLRDLDLKDHNIKFLPQSFGKLKHLKSLDLNFNRIESLPSTFSNLESLKTLTLSNNNLTSLPGEILTLTSLEWLDLGSNRLEALPKSIGQLKSLKTLNLGGNKLISLPKEIGDLKSLKILDISYNPLKKLPETILKMKNLNHITISRYQRGLYPLKKLSKPIYFR